MSLYAEETIFCGIYQGNDTLSAYGTDKAETYDIAIHLTDPSLVGAEIKAIRIPLNTNATNVQEYKGWLSKELTLSSGKVVADIMTLDATVSGSWAEAVLAEPYVIEEGGLYAGYSLTVSNVDTGDSSDPNKKPIMVTSMENPDGLLIHTSRTFREWASLVDVGSPAIVVKLGGHIVKRHAATIEAPENLFTLVDQGLSTSAFLVNHGTEDINTVEYEVILNGQTITQRESLPVPGGYYGRKDKLLINIPAIDEKGTFPTTFRVTKINGYENEDPIGETTPLITWVDEIPLHKPLVEGYTGTWCQYCPRAMAGMEKLADVNGDEFVGISYHIQDEMEFSSSVNLPAHPLGLPSVFIDRVRDFEPLNGQSDWESRRNIIAPATISVVGEWVDEAKTKIKVTSTTTFIRNFVNNPYRISYILIANDLHSTQWKQSNYLSGTSTIGDPYYDKYCNFPNPIGDLHYNDVAIAQSAQNGIGLEESLPAEVQGNISYMHEFVFDIAECELPLNKGRMEVVAVLINTATGEVVNCNNGYVDIHYDDATITAVNKTMVYGDVVPELTYNTSGGDLNGIPQLSTTATSTSPVGTYPITITQGSVNNPNVTYVNGTLTILPAPLVITANSYVRKLGDENPAFEATYTGFKNGEDKNVLIQQPRFSCSATASSAEGEYTIEVADAQAQNYVISYVNGILSVVDYITFADNTAEALCVNNWDTNKDGVLSKSEAASVTNIGTVFRYSNITSFDELKYFFGLTSIPSNAFYGCSSLSTIIIPQNIISIGSFAFYNCSSLISITIPNSVTSIGNKAFYGCSGLTSLTIGNSVTSIGEYAFYNCPQCSSITLPDDIISIGTSAFTSSIKLYVNRGTKTLLALWNAKYTSPYETDTETVLPPSSISVETTQMTATVKVNNFYSEFTNTLNDEELSSDSKIFYAYPEYSERVTLRVSKDNVTYMPSSITYTTKSINPTATRTEATASSMTVVASYLEGDAPVTDQTLTVNGVTVKGNSLYIHGLSPGSSYKATYTIKVDDKYEYTGTAYLSTYSLSFTNSQPKVISEGNVIVASTSNLDEEETNVGFEWRRTDWTNEFMSNTAVAYLYQGTIEGYIRNMNANYLWKFRPYYEADNGSRYYGSWTGIDPTNTSYFEPTVHTYARIEVNGNNAKVKGYAMRGSDNIVSQGFKYWEDNASKGNQIPSNATTVEASGTVMNVELTDLSYNTTYRCVAFATTTEGETFYGEEMSFTTESNILGDVNFDGQISIADVTALVNIILGKDNVSPYQYDHAAADVNTDGNISIADVTALVNIILGKP